MLTETQINQASGFLLRHGAQQTRCQNLPADMAPETRAEGYRIQALVEQQSGAPLYGWKIAATSLAGQKHIGVDGPLAGRYITERVVPSGGAIPFGNNHMKVAEVEFAFRLGRDLPPRATPYGEDEIFAAVATLHPTIEIPDSRYDRFELVGAPALIADNACAHWLAVGAAMPESWRTMDLAAYEPLGRITGKSEIKGKGSNVLGSPRTAMTWLVDELSALGITAKAGQLVTTGTCVVPMAIAPGDEVIGEFPGLGSVSVRLT